jgi:hypothetical protein
MTKALEFLCKEGALKHVKHSAQHITFFLFNIKSFLYSSEGHSHLSIYPCIYVLWI